MDCKNTKYNLSRYIGKQLESRLAGELEEHIAQCPECAEILEKTRKVDEYLTSIPEQKAPAWLKERLNRELDKEQLKSSRNSGRPFNYLFGFRGLAAAVVCAVVCVFIWDRGIENPPAKLPAPEQAQIAQKPMAQTSIKKEFTEVIRLNPGQVVYRGPEVVAGSKKILRQWKDTASGITDRETLVIKNRGEWEKLWRKHSADIIPAPALPEIDFDNNLVAAVFLGEQESAGYGIRILRVRESKNNIYIDLEETMPSKGAVAVQIITRPYHIVVVNK